MFQVVAFVAFLCYAVASRPPYIAATLIELLITTGLLLLYLFNLHKTLTFFFWPLIVRGNTNWMCTSSRFSLVD